MLGHRLWRHLHDRHEVWVTLRRTASSYAQYKLFDTERTIGGFEARSTEALVSAFRRTKPEVVVNCVGIIKQLKEAQDPLMSIWINALLPHRLAELCGLVGSRLVHISTDCVFSGKKGNYTEEDYSDAEDLYGRSKFLGEVAAPHCLTLRTSIIGREVETRSGLVEWFLSQQGREVKGYQKAIYSGLTTLELARVIEDMIVNHPSLSGVWQVSSDPIDKYELLCLLRRNFGWAGSLLPDDTFRCDRSLDSRRFRSEARYQPPSWDAMIEELAVSDGKSR